MSNIFKIATLIVLVVSTGNIFGQNEITNSTSYSSDKFKQLKEELPGPNMYRSCLLYTSDAADE